MASFQKIGLLPLLPFLETVGNFSEFSLEVVGTTAHSTTHCAHKNRTYQHYKHPTKLTSIPMIATLPRTMLHKSTPLLMRRAAQQIRAPIANTLLFDHYHSSSSRNDLPNTAKSFHAAAPIHSTAALQFTSTTRGTVSDGVPSENEIQQKTPGMVTRKLRVLDMAVVKQILEELRSVDANSDERYAFFGMCLYGALDYSLTQHTFIIL